MLEEESSPLHQIHRIPIRITTPLKVLSKETQSSTPIVSGVGLIDVRLEFQGAALGIDVRPVNFSIYDQPRSPRNTLSGGT